MSNFAPPTLLWVLSHLITVTLCYYTIDNGKNLRIVSLLATCEKGRVEFFNGSSWGSLTDCMQQFSSSSGKSICQTLGWDSAREYWRGASKFDKNLTINPLTAYTQLANCSSISSHDTCSDCSSVANLDACNVSNSVSIHQQFDIYIFCENYGLKKHSSMYECIASNASDTSDLQQYSSCHSMVFANDETQERNKKLMLSVAGIAIFGSILCVILFAVYSKHQDNKRLLRLNSNESDTNLSRKKANLVSPIGAYKNRSSGFSTVPQGVELPVLHTVTSDEREDEIDALRHSEEEDEDTAYVPPPQPMFVYASRQKIAADKAVDLRLNDMDDMEQDNGYDMEEIIPSVIYNAGNKSPAESYGLIKNEDDEEDDTY